MHKVVEFVQDKKMMTGDLLDWCGDVADFLAVEEQRLCIIPTVGIGWGWWM